MAGAPPAARARTTVAGGGMRPLAAMFTYTGELVANAAGSTRRGAVLPAATGVELTLRLSRLVGWRGGSVFVLVLGTHGGVPSDLVGDVQGVSNLQAALRQQFPRHRPGARAAGPGPRSSGTPPSALAWPSSPRPFWRGVPPSSTVRRSTAGRAGSACLPGRRGAPRRRGGDPLAIGHSGRAPAPAVPGRPRGSATVCGDDRRRGLVLHGPVSGSRRDAPERRAGAASRQRRRILHRRSDGVVHGRGTLGGAVGFMLLGLGDGL
jgi:hypothetical protein